jgi:hypothetical protein
MKAPPLENAPTLYRLIAMVLNPFLWRKLFYLFLHFFFPKTYPCAAKGKPALNASLVKLNGEKCELNDYLKLSYDMPLVVKMSSYN